MIEVDINMVQERLWIDHHTPHPVHHSHPHPKTELVCQSPENGFDKNHQSTESSDSEDLHYGPGIVNRLKNKYLSLALRESNARPTILRKATSLENLLDEDEGEDGEKENERLFRRRGGGKDGGSHLNHYRSGNRRQDMKRARSVETISRVSHDEELTMTASVTAKINNRQSLHEDVLLRHPVEEVDNGLDKLKTNSRPSSNEHKADENITNKLNGRAHRTWWKSPLLDEKEKPPADVVKQTKMIFEKRPEQRTRKPPQTGDVAAKVDSFNNIIVKAKVASKTSKPPIKHIKSSTNDKHKNQHHHRPVAKPVILNEDIIKPKTLDLKGSKRNRKDIRSLPSPIPDVSRVDIRNQETGDARNSIRNHLCETPDLILTSSPLPKVASPGFRKHSPEYFMADVKLLLSPEATNRFVSPVLSPKQHHLHEDKMDLPGIKLISPISQNNITKSSASSVFNFINAQVDQKHLPIVNKNVSDDKVPVSEPLNIEVNGSGGEQRMKRSLSAIEIEKNHKNSLKSAEDNQNEVEEVTHKDDETLKKLDEKKGIRKIVESLEKIEKEMGIPSSVSVEVSSDNQNGFSNNSKNSFDGSGVTEHIDKPKSITELTGTTVKTAPKYTKPASSSEITSPVSEKSTKDVDRIDRVALKPVQSVSENIRKTNDEGTVKILLPKKPKPRVEESTTAVFNFTTRTDVPDYIANDKSRTPSLPVIPKPDEPGIKIISETFLSNFKEIQELMEEDDLIRALETRPPSPCDVTFLNDNILIDGKSSLIQCTSKRTKLKISFVDDAEIYEYPSETSVLLEDSALSSPLGGAVGHSVPLLSGSTLATYIPKSTEEFQLGVTKAPPPPSPKPDVTEVPEMSEVILEEVDQPVAFSSGGTTDMLF
ncbi:uncharacterized protein LOC115887881 isoform X2 [Sitophilus oryzae]|uniref:Uncharacterized protein LOC115887881 isoform X2 n=1 Tax=Sitophilus oryzae TaxID=7048 RepID=A0A6J2YGY0_SITOR|nr:uncharacterized protein LOC115887881 isoform X2 [Sitophilus oryzae]